TIQHGETAALVEQSNGLRTGMKRHAAASVLSEVLDGSDERLPRRRQDLNGAEQGLASSSVVLRETGRVEDDHSSGGDVGDVEKPARVVEGQSFGDTAYHRDVADEASGFVDDADATVHRHFHAIGIRTHVWADAADECDAEVVAEDEIARCFATHDVARVSPRPAPHPPRLRPR